MEKPPYLRVFYNFDLIGVVTFVLCSSDETRWLQSAEMDTLHDEVAVWCSVGVRWKGGGRPCGTYMYTQVDVDSSIHNLCVWAS